MDNNNKTILIVDDSPHSRFILRTIIAPFKCIIIDVSSAEDALEVMKTRKIDLMITDINLGGTMNGQQLAKHIQSTMTKGLRPIVLAITADSFFEPEAGEFDGVLLKPYKLEKFQQQIKKLLSI